jgi:hypothetical protein
MKKFLLLALLCSAAEFCSSCADLKPTPNLTVRSTEEEALYRLSNCLNAGYRSKADCVASSQSFCTEAGLEPDFAADRVQR